MDDDDGRAIVEYIGVSQCRRAMTGGGGRQVTPQLSPGKVDTTKRKGSVGMEMNGELKTQVVC